LQTPGPETLEVDAQGRENVILDVALPVLAAWSTSARVLGFRSSMGVSGLSPREVARLRTLGLAMGARATGLFEGATDFRMGFPSALAAGPIEPAFGVEADLGGHPLAPVVSDLMVASFGLAVGRRTTHQLRGFTHHRGADAQGHGARTLEALGRELGLELEVSIEELGFEPQGLGRIAVSASRSVSSKGRCAVWTDRGELRAVHARLGGVRPRLEQFDRLEEVLRETWWEARRIEPVIERLITPGVDLGAFLQMDVEFERGGATFMSVVSRSAAPLPLARRAVLKAQSYIDSGATCDEVTGVLALAAAMAARARIEMTLRPSARLSAACGVLRDIGARIEEEEARGLVLLKTVEA
jgi:RNA 3'-terminal phosphate cyclase